LRLGELGGAVQMPLNADPLGGVVGDYKSI